MDVTLLERLEKKSVAKKKKPVQIIIKKGAVQIKTTVIDKTDSSFDIKAFKQRLKQRALPWHDKLKQKSAPAVQKSVIKKVEKLKSKIKLPGEKVSKKKKKKRKPKRREDEIKLDIAATLIEIEDRPIGDRITKRDPDVLIKMDAYYLNNREMFVNFINSAFRTYKKKIGQQENDISCDSKKSDTFDLMVHQKIVRDYMNIYTPYRGLLLYHGLGAGKTCASIAIAEGMKGYDKEVVIMTPASLRMNYISELKHCGDSLYKLNQFWEKIETKGNKHIEQALSEILGLTTKYIRKEKGAWLVDMKKESNFAKLSPEQQKSIDTQINKMIMKKYKLINYNGIRKSHLTDLIEISKADHGTSNPFDNKIIIIDEAHNFVSRIVNKINQNKTSLSTQLYKLILSANNCRVVFLTGTPIINYPNEIGILFNMLRGYIKTFYFPLNTSKTSEKINREKIVSILNKYKLVDYIEYKSSSNTLIITRNPFGFVSRSRHKEYVGVSTGNTNLQYNKAYLKNKKKKLKKLIKADKSLRDDNFFKKKIIRILGEKNIEVAEHSIKVENHKALPDTLKTFNPLFIDSVSGDMKNTNLFKRRIIGLTSYFRSAQEALLPRYNEESDTHIIKIPMSRYQLGLYEEARVAERKEEKRNAKKKKKQANDDIYGKTTSTYRIFSRAFCNFVFPNEIDEETQEIIRRPMPKDGNTISDALTGKKGKKGKSTRKGLDEDIVDGDLALDRLDNIDGRYDADDKDALEKNIEENTDDSYPVRIQRALKLLTKNASTYLSPEGLKIYGPKFLEILKNLQNPEYPGLHLIYSQFRTLEGIGILALILEHNGFARLKISKASGIWALTMDQEDLGKPVFALYTGTETAEEKEITRNIFNGTWDALPTPLAAQLEKISANNNMGEVVKILMITSSGSEGITLKNTRYVHIIEPYWHPVRTEQVIGRARRICSHHALDEEYKTVEVFFYLMTFTEKQLKGDPAGKNAEEKAPAISLELRIKDLSKIDGETPLTSDEALFEISRIKQNISKNILKAIKESSIDCAIHYKSNVKEGIACYSFGSPSVNSFSYKPELSSEEHDIVTNINKQTIKWIGKVINIQGTNYVIKPADPKNDKVGEIYDLESYQQAKKHGTNPILVGKTIVNPKNKANIQYITVGDHRF